MPRLKNSSYYISILSAISIVLGCINFSCKEQQSSVSRPFLEDSLKVWHLLNAGSELYAKRNSMEQIGESLLYFDSANRLAQQLGDEQLLANTLYYIGNVYNAWNGEPEKTADYYEQAAESFARLPGRRMRIKEFYLRQLVAHAYDNEKGNDSTKSIAALTSAFTDVQRLEQSVQDSMIYLTDYAWVASNAGNYSLAEVILGRFNHRPVNDPESNNYLDHYYLTRARIAMAKSDRHTVYTDSLEISLQQAGNRFDSAYLTLNLAILFDQEENYRKAYSYSVLNASIQNSIVTTDILSALRTQILKSSLEVEKAREIQNREKLKIKNLYLWAGSLLFIILLLLIAVYVIYQKRKGTETEIAQQGIFTQMLLQYGEEERQRIAMELHDGINHELLSLKNNLLLNRPLSPGNVEDIIHAVREISRNLYPSLFETVGLQASVQGLCSNMTEAGFFTTCDIQYTDQLPAKEALHLYRIIQEALNNAARHAGAEACKITITTTASRLITEIKDNGRGFDAVSVQPHSFGLQSMRQRAKAINGQLSVKSSAGGTIITLTKLLS